MSTHLGPPRSHRSSFLRRKITQKKNIYRRYKKGTRKKSKPGVMGFLFSKPQAPQRAPQRAPQMRPLPLPHSEPTRTPRPSGPMGTVGTVGPPGSVGPPGTVGPSLSLGPTVPLGPTGPLGPLGQTVPPGPTGPLGPLGPSGPPLGPQAACCTLQAARCAACTLGTTVDAYCATRGDDARCRVWLGLTARVPENVVKEQLGYTLLDRPVELNYGTSSQWIQANDGVRDPQNHDLGWPWGSIEGGHLVSRGSAARGTWSARRRTGGTRGATSRACAQALRERERGSRCRCPTATARDRGSPRNRAQAQAHAPFRDLASSSLSFFWSFSFFFLGGGEPKLKKTKGSPRALRFWGA